MPGIRFVAPEEENCWTFWFARKPQPRDPKFRKTPTKQITTRTTKKRVPKRRG